VIFIDEIFKLFIVIIEQEPVGHQRPVNQDKSSGLFSPPGCVPSREPKKLFHSGLHVIFDARKKNIIHQGA